MSWKLRGLAVLAIAFGSISVFTPNVQAEARGQVAGCDANDGNGCCTCAAGGWVCLQVNINGFAGCTYTVSCSAIQCNYN